MVQGASQPWGKNFLGRGKCLWPYIQAPPPSHSLSTFSMATFSGQTALLMVLQLVCLPGHCPSFLPLSLMSQGFAQFPPLPTKPFKSLPIRRAPSPLRSPGAFIWHLLALLPYMGRHCITMYLNLLPHLPSLPRFLSKGLLRARGSFSLSLTLPRPIPGPQLTDTQGV